MAAPDGCHSFKDELQQDRQKLLYFRLSGSNYRRLMLKPEKILLRNDDHILLLELLSSKTKTMSCQRDSFVRPTEGELAMKRAVDLKGAAT
jgi:hypothetical protein